MPLTSLRRSPLVELAVSQLREQVLSGQWPVGGRLPAETELAQRLEVGRSTVARPCGRWCTRGCWRRGRDRAPTSARSRRAATGSRGCAGPRCSRPTRCARRSRCRPRGWPPGGAPTQTSRRCATCLAERQTRPGPGAEDAGFVEADLAFHRARRGRRAQRRCSPRCSTRSRPCSARRSSRSGPTAASTCSGADPAHARLAAAIEAGDAAAAEHATHDHLDPTAANLRSLIDR